MFAIYLAFRQEASDYVRQFADLELWGENASKVDHRVKRRHRANRRDGKLNYL